MKRARRVRRVVGQRVAAWWATRRRASRAVRRRFEGIRLTPQHARRHVLVAPPGNGNIGDQAMVEAYLELVDGPITLVVRHRDDITVPAADTGRVRIVALPDLIFGRPEQREADLIRYELLVREAAGVAVVGADMLDGTYTVVGSVNRLLLAELAASAGIPTRVLGFSWNTRHRRAALGAIVSAGLAGVELIVRDPDSLGRLRRLGVPGVIEGADIVFAAQRIETPDVDPASPYALLNVSALVRRRITAAEYVPIVRHLRSRGLQVVLLPHVLRGTSNDVDACEEVLAMIDDPGVTMVRSQLTPPQVRGLAGGALAVVTGRMHLAIMSASVGVPPIVFATQGKVRGMLALLGIDRLCVEPHPAMASEVGELVDAVLEDDRLRDLVAERFGPVRESALRNVLGTSSRAVEEAPR